MRDLAYQAASRANTAGARPRNLSHRLRSLALLLPTLSLALAVISCAPMGARSTTPLVSTFDDGGNSFSTRLLRHPAISIALDSGVDGSDAIRVIYQGSPEGSERVIVSHRLPARLLEATLVYDVKFCDAFQFVKSGKLHGLGPKSLAAGGLAFQPEQWSARVAFLANGRIGTYLYHQDLAGQYGEITTAPDFWFVPNRYYRVALYVRLNDPPEMQNGRAELFVDGRKIVSRDHLRFRAVGSKDTLIRKLLFNTFHGGHTPDYAPRNSDGSFSRECAYFDNIAVYPGFVVPPPPGNLPSAFEDRS